MGKQDFLIKMETVFENLKDKKAIVLGDFNINMHNDNSLTKIAHAHGFVPLINCSTTVNDSLLDQIFINSSQLEKGVKTVFLQSYFSDHDLVVMCIPKAT